MAWLEGFILLQHAFLSTTARKQGKAPRVVELLLTVVSWNVHGSTHKGMAGARNLLVPRVIERINPDVLLLQETKTDKLVKRIIEASKPRRSYVCIHTGDKKEAQILYDSKLYNLISLDEQLEEAIDSVVLEQSRDKMRSPLQAEQYKQRISIAGLGQKIIDGRDASQVVSVPNMTVFMSFHNVQRGVGQGGVKDAASIFCKVVVKMGELTRALVVAGADLNCNCRNFETHGAEIPVDYVLTKRRRHSSAIDYFVLGGFLETIRICNIRAEDIVHDKDNHSNILHDVITDLLREAAQCTCGRAAKYGLDDYSRALNHDPLTCELTLTVMI